MRVTIQRSVQKAACTSLLLLSALGAEGQGTFQNLGFESANLSPIPAGQLGGYVSSLDAIPHWTAFLGTNQLAGVLQNNFTIGNASVDIIGPSWSSGGVIEGQYTVWLEPGYNPSDPFHVGYLSASIMQVGLVPVNAQSIQLKASAGSPFTVSLAGEELSLIILATEPNYILYGADISSFAGQSGALTITAQPAFNNLDEFDSIQFSSQPIPEPGVLSLAGLGVLLTCAANFRWSEWLARHPVWQFGSCWRASHRSPLRWAANMERP
jgi:hypothetical protein